MIGGSDGKEGKRAVGIEDGGKRKREGGKTECDGTLKFSRPPASVNKVTAILCNYIKLTDRRG